MHRLRHLAHRSDPATCRPVDDKADGDVEITLCLSKGDRRVAARLLNALAGEGNDRGLELSDQAEGNAQTFNDQAREVLVERARQTFANRARRSKHFNPIMFGEAAWDMLLALYVTERSKARHTVTRLCELSGVPLTTALRWLDLLEKQEGLVARSPSPTDKRVYRIELTEKARLMLDAYFSGTAPEGP